MLLLSVGPVLAGCSTDADVSSEPEACRLATAGVAAIKRFPASRIASCDHLVAASNPPGYYVLALHSDRQCEGICSTHLGWYAVQRSNGEVFDWDVAESRLGPPIVRRP